MSGIMREKKFITIYRKAKIIQLCVLVAIEVFFIGILMANPAMTRRIFEDRTLYLLSAAVWVLMIVALLFLVYDFFKLRSFEQMNYALNTESYPDDLTDMPDHGMDAIFQTYSTPESMANVGCCMITIDNLEAANQSDSRQTADRMIQDFSSILESAGDLYGTVNRIGNNEFLVVIDRCDKEAMERFIRNLEDRIISYNREHERFPLQLQSTYILNSEERMETFTQLLIATYNRLHNK